MSSSEFLHSHIWLSSAIHSPTLGTIGEFQCLGISVCTVGKKFNGVDPFLQKLQSQREQKAVALLVVPDRSYPMICEKTVIK